MVRSLIGHFPILYYPGGARLSPPDGVSLRTPHQAEFPNAPPLQVIDAYALSALRGEHTVRHTDLVHYCDEVNAQLGQLVMHSLCPCAS
jgi:hypothetical protein